MPTLIVFVFRNTKSQNGAGVFCSNTHPFPPIISIIQPICTTHLRIYICVCVCICVLTIHCNTDTHIHTYAIAGLFSNRCKSSSCVKTLNARNVNLTSLLLHARCTDNLNFIRNTTRFMWPKLILLYVFIINHLTVITLCINLFVFCLYHRYFPILLYFNL